MFPRLVFFVSVFLLNGPAAYASDSLTYYVDSERGNDQNDGTSPDKAWQTIKRVNDGYYEAGSRVLFHADQTFAGSLYLNQENTSGTAEKPVMLGSYGNGPATITSGDELGLFIHNASDIRVENLKFAGNAGACGGGGFEGSHGILLRNDLNKDMSRLTLEGLEVTGYCVGILGTAWEDNATGRLQNVRISKVAVHDNRASGIMVMGRDARTSHYTLENISVSEAIVYNHPGVDPPKEPGANLSGSAIMVYEADGVLLERNVAYDNGGNNACLDGGKTGGGPAAIWAYGKNIAIQYNEVFRQRISPECPWDGFAFNGNGSNVLIQYNYSHDNDGPAILQDNRPGQSNNAVRYNISENDCRASNNQGMIMLTGGGENFHVYNNTIVSSRKAGSLGPLVYVGSQNDHGSGRMSNASFRNNIFVSDNEGPLLMGYLGDLDEVRFENNAYHDPSGRYEVDWNGTIFHSVANWSKETGQETDGKRLFAHVVNPTACALYRGGTRHPEPLEGLMAYRLAPTSPLIDEGWDLARYGIDSGSRDFFGNPVSTGAAPDIGAHEYQKGQQCP